MEKRLLVMTKLLHKSQKIWKHWCVFNTSKGVAMTTENHIEALKQRHSDLERQLENELRHNGHDDLVIADIKRRKLEVKDELTKLARAAA